jgi:hypothetical protein
MLKISRDVYQNVLVDYLSDIDRIRLCSVNKYSHKYWMGQNKLRYDVYSYRYTTLWIAQSVYHGTKSKQLISFYNQICRLKDVTEAFFDFIADNKYIKSIKNIHEIIFHHSFNRVLNVDNISYLIHLKRLEFGNNYNQTIDLTLLSQLEHLQFGDAYNQLTDLSSLVNLKSLTFGCQYDRITDISSLGSLQTLTLHNNNFKKAIYCSVLLDVTHLEYENIKINCLLQSEMTIHIQNLIATANIQLETFITIHFQQTNLKFPQYYFQSIM